MYLKEIIELLSVKGLGMQTFHKLLTHYGDLEALFDHVNKGRLYKDTNIAVTKDIKSKMQAFDLSRYEQSLERENVRVASVCNEKYPRELKNIANFPPIIHYKGNLDLFNAYDSGIAVVGSRKISAYGSRVAYDIGRYLGRYELPVISGLAYGVDYEVHKGVLSVDGIAAAVVANGLETIYPKEHKIMAEKIEKNGVLLTEEFLYSGLSPYKFPIRNRIISGLSSTIVVVEAEERSGSITTAMHGLEQGKTVFSVPGSIYSATSKGTNKLISEGAIPLLDFSQLLEGREIKYKTDFTKKNQMTKENFETASLEKKIINLLSQTDALSVDELSIKLNIDLRLVTIEVMKLEIKGQIRGIIGNKYTLL